MSALTPLHPDGPLSLALAVVGASTTPLALLDDTMKLVAVSDSFCRQFYLDEDRIVGRLLFELGTGEWNVPQLKVLLAATAVGKAAIEAYQMDLVGGRKGTRRLVIRAHLLEYGQTDPVRLLLAIEDITDAQNTEKLKDDLLREKAVLLQELQHRVANSLQIIASVILQSARNVQSEETRLHLKDAHNRVMSVAALQQQLSQSRLGEVALRAYFEQLCLSLGASMIHDPLQLTLRVEADDSTTDAEVSVSLGLIVTELVINALKHAFPDHRRGRITVSYATQGADWTLAVHDDGVGMPPDPVDAKAGLGTSIVEALARQLKARVDVAPGHPGTTISIIHTHRVAVEESDRPAV
jgi:two-component sensor histidine kinase